MLRPRTNAYDGEKEYWVKTRVSGKREAEEMEEITHREQEDDQDNHDCHITLTFCTESVLEFSQPESKR